MDMKVLVAMHKSTRLPKDPVYLPVQVGAALHPPLVMPGIRRDNEGESISAKNPNYCELTALYWGWKNVPCQYLGLVHYRRYFASIHREKNPWQRIASQPELERMLEQTGVVLPKKRHYWIETNYSQYIHAHHAQDLHQTRAILERKWPDYLPAYDRVMKRTSGHRFNMFIMRRDLLDAYCSWLFDLLFTLEQELDISQYSPNDARVFGFVSERLLDVWLETNQIDYREMPVIFTEPQNWLKKGGTFLRRKFFGKKA